MGNEDLTFSIHTEDFDAEKETPVMHQLAVEHLKHCRACNERAARHHLGVEPVLTDVEVQQQFEAANSILLHIENLLREYKVWWKDANKIWYGAGVIIGFLGGTLGNYILRWLFGW